MIKRPLSIMCTLVLFLSLTLIGCTKANEASNKNNTNNSTTTQSIPDKTFTLDELKKYDGQNGNPAYVAVSGIVYDVTNAEDWHNGKHKNGITAGKDLTQEIKQAAHGTKVLNNLPIVGKLK